MTRGPVLDADGQQLPVAEGDVVQAADERQRGHYGGADAPDDADDGDHVTDGEEAARANRMLDGDVTLQAEEHDRQNGGADGNACSSTFIQDIYIAPLQVYYYSKALPTIAWIL